MNFFQAVSSVFKNYATFSGRAPRSEYWYWVLFYIIASTAAKILDVAVFNVPFESHELHPLHAIFVLVTLMPALAVAVRRLHDVNRSGWWLLIMFTLIGILFPILVWKCTKGTAENNRFGSNPLP